MVPLEEIPFDAWQWLVISFIFAVLSWRSLVSYRNKKNEVSGFFVIMAAFTSLVYLIWGIVPILTADDTLIRYGTMTGDILLAIPISMHAYLLWFLVLRDKGIRLWIPVVAAVVLTLWSTASVLANAVGNPEYAYLTEENTLQISNLPHAQSIMFLFFLVPLAIYFFKSGLQSSESRQRTRSFALAIIYAGLSGIEIYANSFSGNDISETSERLVIFGTVAIFGILFFIVASFSRKK